MSHSINIYLYRDSLWKLIYLVYFYTSLYSNLKNKRDNKLKKVRRFFDRQSIRINKLTLKPLTKEERLFGKMKRLRRDNSKEYMINENDSDYDEYERMDEDGNKYKKDITDVFDPRGFINFLKIELI